MNGVHYFFVNVIKPHQKRISLILDFDVEFENLHQIVQFAYCCYLTVVVHCYVFYSEYKLEYILLINVLLIDNRV